MQSIPVLEQTLAANGDYSAKRYCFARMTSTAHTFQIAGAAPDDIIGVLQDTPSAAGRPGRIRSLGTSEVLAGATFSAGAKLTSDANGKAVAATSGQKFFAIALEACTNANDIVEAMLVSGVAA